MSYEFLKCYTNEGKDWASKTEDCLLEEYAEISRFFEP